MKRYIDKTSGKAFMLIQRGINWVRVEPVHGGTRSVEGDSFWFTKQEFETYFTPQTLH